MKKFSNFDKVMRNKNIIDYDARKREVAEITSQYYPDIKKYIITEIEKGKTKNEAVNTVLNSRAINIRYPKISRRDVREKLNYIISIDKDLNSKNKSDIDEEQER